MLLGSEHLSLQKKTASRQQAGAELRFFCTHTDELPCLQPWRIACCSDFDTV